MDIDRRYLRAWGAALSYAVTLEAFDETYDELEPMYRQHYAAMRNRKAELGIETSDYAPRLDEYVRASKGGWLLTFVLRFDGRAVGYSNIYVTNDMHNRDKIAKEDTIFVVPEHRNGSGRSLARAVHAELKARGVKRLDVTTATDLRVAKWLARQGYKHTAHEMTLTF